MPCCRSCIIMILRMVIISQSCHSPVIYAPYRKVDRPICYMSIYLWMSITSYPRNSPVGYAPYREMYRPVCYVSVYLGMGITSYS